MPRFQRSRSHLLAAVIACGIPAVARAQVSTWHDIGQIGGPIFWAAGLGSSLLQDGKLGPLHAAKTFDGMLVAGGLAEVLQVATREKRPYGSAHDSFPSGHAAISFAVAGAQSYFHPREAPLWFGAATLIGVARVAGHDHFIQDVIVGAGIGWGAGYLSASSRHGWLLAPVVGRQGAGVMLSFSKSF